MLLVLNNGRIHEVSCGFSAQIRQLTIVRFNCRLHRFQGLHGGL